MQVGIPVLGLRTRSESNNGQTYLELLASYGAAEPSWAIWDNWSTETTTGTFSIISIKKRFAPNQGEDYLKKIITVRQGAQELHKGQHDSCAFSVECIKPCPPNTLDCGGCCLDCAGIFNQLSALTKKVLSMK
ncbi:hypothetical protein [Trichormus sp. NMC-1]|uniref:hypothetical protein n=1 Tax=Trichormus sp. NMC-1 TaxID=1853259 RepID=UPI00115FE8BC|nr:hypothetical protein [Trichormus sp. NMC-1]